MRVYLPATLRSLAAASDQGRFGPPPLAACAVTPTLREWYAAADLEELEYAAATEAARASLGLLARDPEAPRRRVVVAADVPDGVVAPDPAGSRAAVTLSSEVLWRWVASVQIDDPDGAEDVGAATRALKLAAAGDEDAAFVVDSAQAHELMWFATQEIPELLGGG